MGAKHLKHKPARDTGDLNHSNAEDLSHINEYLHIIKIILVEGDKGLIKSDEGREGGDRN